MDKLQEFYNDIHMQNAWAAFIVEVLETEIIKRAYKKEDTKDLAEARKIIEKSFVTLAERFEVKKEREVEIKGV